MGKTDNFWPGISLLSAVFASAAITGVALACEPSGDHVAIWLDKAPKLMLEESLSAL
jgi:hypothetical protein